MKDFVEKHKNEVFRYVQYRKIWTPYEMEEKFKDESETEVYYNFARIADCFDLGSGDYLLELESGEINTEYDENDNEIPVFCPSNIIKYRRLSEIQIEKFGYDNETRTNEESERYAAMFMWRK